ncbi:MAG: DUF3152 domain-containing protein [Actinomycetota bacterium]|nr:DUF3152 domain-containing protein [Actinomycetota bacterium]
MTGRVLMGAGAWWLELLIALLIASVIGGGVAMAGQDPQRSRPVAANATAGSSPSATAGDSTERPSASPHPSPKAKKKPLELNGKGTLQLVEGTSEVFGSGPLHGFAVEVERGLPVDAQGFADDAVAVLADERSWIGVDGISVQRVPVASASFRVTLAGPALTDELCAPLETNGIYSCFNAGRAVINFYRWMKGASAYGDDLASYRQYVINHEVGHAFGHGHVDCLAAEAPAPIMMQQTKGVAPCRPNPWPATS